MGWLLILLLKFLLFSCGSSRNLLNPCDRAVITNIFDMETSAWSTVALAFEQDIFKGSKTWFNRSYVYINCSCRGLTEVPQNLPEALDLNFNVIRRVKATDFVSYPNISLLFLEMNCLDTVRPSGVRPLPPCNGDLYIEPGALKRLVYLKHLNLVDSKLREFPRHLPTSLKVLDISFTGLPDVTAQLRELPNLNVLVSIGNCYFVKDVDRCPKNFTITQPLFSGLQYLDLAVNNWRMIPGYLLGTQLKVLSLAMNPILRLSKNDFVNATSLEMLNLCSMSLIKSLRSLIIEDGVFDPLIHLKYLDLSFNLVQFLTDGIFKNNKNLEMLDLSFNCLKLTIFEPTYLVNLHKLRYVDLSSNNVSVCGTAEPIKSLRLGQAFASLSSLKTIIFGNERKHVHSVLVSMEFHEIDNQSFSNLSNLTHLSTIDISYCNVHHISSDAWSGLRHLKSIRASNNILSFKEDALSKKDFQTLQTRILEKHFSFLEKNFEQHKKRTFKIPDLECKKSGLLDYSNNQITTISEQKALLLSKTTILDLSQNRISVIRSDDLRHLINLCSIDLSHNPLRSIDPFTFSNLSSLREFDIVGKHMDPYLDLSFLLHFNPYSKVELNLRTPAGMLVLGFIRLNHLYRANMNSSIVELNIAQSVLNFPHEYEGKGFFKFMPKLRHLVLRDCKISSPIPDYWFQGSDHLEILDLSHNKLATFPSTSLKILNKLHSLNLDLNNIIELNGNLTVCPNLKHFTIAHNKIKFIQPGFFLHLKLETLDLSHNYITQLDSSIFSKDVLNSLQYLDIRWNELDCFCHEWQKFYRWYISDASDNTKLPGFYHKCTSIIDQYYGGCVACHSPLNLRGRPVSRYGINTSCDLQTHLKYTIAFTIFFVLFMLCGSVGYSKWFKRLIFRKVNEYFRVQALKPSDVSSRYSTNEGKKAFVFFDHSNDELGDWVDDKLVPGMINGNPSIELLLAGRDIDAGMSPNENLLRLITKSRKTIVIFSGNFCDTPTCKFVLQALQELQHSAGRDQLILVEWHGEEAARVPELIQRTFNRKFYNFLRFDQTNDDEVMFFETLRTAFASNTALDRKLLENGK
ncbi:toll-like receptor 8 [Clavelina lepadiformis]|uniref:toll-like receptor 8 n=1 Tax=Clavelina lepadiformis TaxID=159417 RepID=UPI00404346F7